MSELHGFEADEDNPVLTVSRLKAILSVWPETDSQGEPAEVWIETGYGLSSACLRLVQLGEANIILESDAWLGR